MTKRFVMAVLVALCLAAPAASQAPRKLDLNRATLAEMQTLPIPADVARDLYEHRLYRGYFASLYDLRDVPSVTPEILRTLGPLVSTLPPPKKNEAQQRYDASFRQVQDFLSQEGAREEIADEYLDQLRDPANVNALDLFELQSYQNVSPIDAAAILRGVESAGNIENERQLRSVDGLSYWAFRNLRDFVVYENPEQKTEVHGDVQVTTFNTPYRLDDRDILVEPIPLTGVTPTVPDFETQTGWGIRDLDSPEPAVRTKARLRFGHGFKGGFTSFRDVGEDELGETLKYFASWENPSPRRSKVGKVVAGNFRVAWGQGLVMDNSDFFLPRKTGYGFDKRPMSILGDLSRTQEFALFGGALEGRVGPFRGLGFFSTDKKDALMNEDGTINKYVIMGPRFEQRELEAMSTLAGQPFLLRRDAFNERMYGGAGQLELWPGTYVGLSGWEARYNREWNPKISTIVDREDLLEARDAELFKAYDSRNLGQFRRVFGAEFQTVHQNFALQGEYGKLDASLENGLDGLFSAAPEAYVVNAYVQYSDLNVLGVWRDYDVGYDNPYARPFSEDSRYEQMLLGDPFRLQNPLLSFLDENTPQPKAERGLFISLRYRVSRKFTIGGLEFDQWQRLADGQEQRRYVARLEYAPIFPLRFRLRQRFSSRGDALLQDVRRFRGWDTRLETRVRLSGFDELRFLYSVTNTEFAARPRLSGQASAQPDLRTPLGQAASPSQALQAALEHNVNDALQFVVSTEMFDGFLFNFEDNEFIVLDDIGFRNWFLIRSRLSDALMMRFKLTAEKNLARSNVDIRDFESPLGVLFEGNDTRSLQTSFRLQLDYTF